jgi:prepilin-type N-terminal cleavage/methylation domain-containing protein
MPLDRPDEAAMTRGFTLVELLVALTITVLIAGALAQAMPAARAAFERVPAELDLHQRGRIAIDTLTQALRAADRISVASPDEDGAYLELTAVIPVASPAQGVLSVDQAAPGAPMTLGIDRCPNVKEVCGFTGGTVAMISDRDGHYDVFIVTAVDAALRRVIPDRILSRAYPAGSIVLEVEEHTFGLDLQPDESYSLIRVTAAGAVQPIVDFIPALAFTVNGRQVGVRLTVQAVAESGRTLVGERVFRTSVSVRNVS